MPQDENGNNVVQTPPMPETPQTLEPSPNIDNLDLSGVVPGPEDKSIQGSTAEIQGSAPSKAEEPVKNQLDEYNVPFKDVGELAKGYEHLLAYTKRTEQANEAVRRQNEAILRQLEAQSQQMPRRNDPYDDSWDDGEGSSPKNYDKIIQQMAQQISALSQKLSSNEMMASLDDDARKFAETNPQYAPYADVATKVAKKFLSSKAPTWDFFYEIAQLATPVNNPVPNIPNPIPGNTQNTSQFYENLAKTKLPSSNIRSDATAQPVVTTNQMPPEAKMIYDRGGFAARGITPAQFMAWAKKTEGGVW